MTYRQFVEFHVLGVHLPPRAPENSLLLVFSFLRFSGSRASSGLVAASSAKSSWATHLARAVSSTPVFVTRLHFFVNVTS